MKMNRHWKENDKTNIKMIEKGMNMIEKGMEMKGV